MRKTAICSPHLMIPIFVFVLLLSGCERVDENTRNAKGTEETAYGSAFEIKGRDAPRKRDDTLQRSHDVVPGSGPADEPLEPLSDLELRRIAEKTASTSPLASHLNKKYKDDISGLLEKRYIRVLTTFSKTNFFVSGSEIFGYEYSLLKGYEKYLNRECTDDDLKVVLEFIPVSRDRLIPLLINGWGDVAAAGLTITPERLKRVDFTVPYLTNVDEVVVTNRTVEGLETLEDLSGREVFVRPSSSYHESLVSLNKKFRAKGLDPVKLVKADESLETEDILEMVDSGAIAITVADSHIVDLWSSVFENLRVHYSLKVRTGGEIAWMVRKNNPELKKQLNAFLETHRKGTLLGNIYLRRYFENNRWIKNPFTEEDLKRQNLYRRLIKKYATRYGFDPLLIMALAYQESRLDNSKKNPVGAVGLMQVRTLTAGDRNVNIDDVHLLENNIHAGVKYLDFLRNRYFSSKKIREKDRIRLSLAAYNAGPRKIRMARNLAEKLGLNPDKWFRDVEIATLKLIGQETVQYVSNINKYYLLFKFHQENEKMRRAVKIVSPRTIESNADPG